MRLMYTTALASAVMFAGPALAGGDRVEGTTGMTAPEASAAQLPGQTVDTGMLSQSFAGAGFADWQAAHGAHLLRMHTGDGQPVWVILMPDGFQVGTAEPGLMDHEPGDLAETPLDQPDLPDVSEQAEVGDMPQRSEEADIAETFDDAERPDVAEAPSIAEPGELPDVAEAPSIAEPGELPDVAEAPDIAEPGIVGETEPEGFAARIPGELESDLEGAGFQQIESIDGEVFQARTEDGRTAFIIVGDLGTGIGFDAPGMDQPAPGVAPDLPDTVPGADGPQPGPGEMQQ